MAKKQVNNFQIDEPVKNAIFGVVALVASYGFISWAIDSGSIWHYIFAFTAFYYAVHFFKEAVKLRFFRNDKRKKA